MIHKPTAAQARKLTDAINYIKLFGYEVIRKKDVTCDYCGYVFQVNEEIEQKYCSEDCRAKMRSSKALARASRATG